MQHVNVLLIDDHPGDVHQVWERLVNRPASEAFDLTFHLIYAERLATGLARLHEGNIDIILLELKLPDGRGVDTVQQIVRQAPDLPLIVLTTLEDTALALRTLQAGAPQELEYRATVLLVEADPLVRGLMRNALERTRYRVLEAAEGDEALQVGRRHTHAKLSLHARALRIRHSHLLRPSIPRGSRSAQAPRCAAGGNSPEARRSSG